MNNDTNKTIPNYKTTKNRARNKKTIQLLEKTFPKLFSYKNPKPLKLSVHQDIFDYFKNSGEPIGMCKIKNALRSYTSRKKYYSTLRSGSQRFDIDGIPVGIVSQDEGREAKINFHK